MRGLRLAAKAADRQASQTAPAGRWAPRAVRGDGQAAPGGNPGFLRERPPPPRKVRGGFRASGGNVRRFARCRSPLQRLPGALSLRARDSRHGRCGQKPAAAPGFVRASCGPQRGHNFFLARGGISRGGGGEPCRQKLRGNPLPALLGQPAECRRRGLRRRARHAVCARRAVWEACPIRGFFRTEPAGIQIFCG